MKRVRKAISTTMVVTITGSFISFFLSTPLILASDYIYTFVRNKLSLLSFGNHLISHTPVQQAACPVIHSILCLGSSRYSKCIMCISGEATGEIFSHVSVSHCLCAVHQYLCTIIQLRNTVHCEQHGECLLQCQRIFAVTQESVCVMIFDKCHHATGIWIKIIIYKTIIYSVHSMPPAISFFCFSLT